MSSNFRRAKSRKRGASQAAKGNGNSVNTPVPRTMPGRNGGRLRRGNPGNSGRPASELRAKLIGSALARLPVLEKIADDTKASYRDRIQAIMIMLRYGLNDDANVRASFVREALRSMSFDLQEKLSEFMTPDQVSQFLQGLGKHWDEEHFGRPGKSRS